MDRDTAINLVREFKNSIAERYKPTAVYLYGSYSKGTQRPDSDIDVAVVVSEMKGDWFSVVPGLWTASRKIHELIEPVLIEECHPSPLLEDIKQTGLLIA